MFKHLGLISILLMWLGTYILLQNHSPNSDKSISKHAAKNRKYHVLFAVVELFTTFLFSLFMFGWFIPHFQLGLAYSVATAVGIIGVVIAAFVPETDGWQKTTHTLSAYSMAVMLPILTLLLLTASTVPQLARILCYLSLAYMIVGWYIAIFKNSIFRNNMLKFQVAYFLAFQIPIFVAVYL